MPPLDLDDNKELSDSSNDSVLDDTRDQQFDENGQPIVADGADSSDAHGDNTDDTSSIVRDVVKERTEGAASPADAAKTGTEAAGQPKEEDNENYTDVPFHKHPRFQHLLRERKAALGDAGQYRKVTAFMDQNGLGNDEFANALNILALSKSDPVKAWEMLKPSVQALLQAAGEVLPDNLKQRVAAGELTAEAAAEIARAEARAKSVEGHRSFEQQRRQRQEQQNAGKALTDTAQSWEKDRQAKDPNFAAKQPLLIKEVAFLIQTEGKPNTPEGVKAQLEKAYKAVVLPTAPRRVGQAPRVGDGVNRGRPTANGSASASNLQPQPQTTRDIIRGVIAKRGAA